MLTPVSNNTPRQKSYLDSYVLQEKTSCMYEVWPQAEEALTAAVTKGFKWSSI